MSLQNLGLTEQVISSLLTLLEMEGPFGKISSFLRCITKTKGEVAYHSYMYYTGLTVGTIITVTVNPAHMATFIKH